MDFYRFKVRLTIYSPRVANVGDYNIIEIEASSLIPFFRSKENGAVTEQEVNFFGEFMHMEFRDKSRTS